MYRGLRIWIANTWPSQPQTATQTLVYAAVKTNSNICYVTILPWDSWRVIYFTYYKKTRVTVLNEWLSCNLCGKIHVSLTRHVLEPYIIVAFLCNHIIATSSIWSTAGQHYSLPKRTNRNIDGAVQKRSYIATLIVTRVVLSALVSGN